MFFLNKGYTLKRSHDLAKPEGGLMADEQTSSKIVLSWNQVSGASGYRIYQYDKESDSYVKLKDITDGATTCEVSGLSSATEYRFKVRAFRKLSSTNY